MNNTKIFPKERLGEVTESIEYGLTASANRDKVGPRFLRITDIQDESVLWDKVPYCECPDAELERYSLRKGDIVFARTGATTGKSYLIRDCPEPTVFASYLIRVRPSSRVVPEFLSQFFRTPDYWTQISGAANGSTQPGVNGTKLKELAIPLPTLPEQRRIGAILDKADAIRRKREEGIRLTEELLRSTFLKMFGDPETNPKGWDSVPLSVALTLKSGEFLPGKEMNPEGAYAVYGGNGITGKHDTYLFDERKIVIGRVGIYCGAVHYSLPRSWITDNALYVASAKDGLLDQYLFAALTLANLNQYANQSGQPLISGQRIANVPLLIPPVTSQRVFGVAVEKINSLVAKRTSARDESEALFGSLVKWAFRGEL